MSALTVARAHLDTCGAARGTVVVLDVIRAFTTAAVALAQGAQDIVAVATVEEALALRLTFPGALVMGEVDGLKPAGFDLGNSPAAMLQADVRGRRLIARTSAGTQGIVRSAAADTVLAASFVVAGATARYVRRHKLPQVTLVATGGPTAAEDVACAAYLEGAMTERFLSAERCLEQVLHSAAAAPFFDAAQPDFDPADIDLCCDLDRYDFSMRVHREGGLSILRREA